MNTYGGIQIAEILVMTAVRSTMKNEVVFAISSDIILRQAVFNA